ncbi:MAG: enoyl-CoA hydratase/isomerase family protein [Pseudomonadota bacterium]
MDDILYSTEGEIGIIAFNRPRARNALTFEMYAEVARVCSEAGNGDGIKALIIRGTGEKAFAAGTDIAQFRSFTEPAHAHAYEAEVDRVLNAVETCRVPTLAAIHGACTGGGAAIATACDLRIASADLKFGFPIARTLGNCLSASSLSRVVQLIGAGRTKELLFTSRLIEAEEAKSIGLIAEIVPDLDALNIRARDLAGLLAGQAPLTLRATREAMARLRQGVCNVEDADLVELCYMSADFREGLEAFLQKRPPNWQGR